MGRRLRLWIFAGCAALGLSVPILVAAFRQDTTDPLIILKGRQPDMLKPHAGNAFSLRTYYIKADFSQVEAQAKKELAGWFSNSPRPGHRRWIESPGPFEFHARQVDIRRNRVEPKSMKVLGSAADSKVWVTITVYGGLPDPNFFRGLGRLVTGNKRPV